MENTKTTILHDSALRLQEKLAAGSLDSVTLTETLLHQIELHNQCGLQLNAVISVAPRADVLARARSLDQERSAGTLRSKLHGIPIVIKDAIVTDVSLGMPTTVGSHVFAALKAKRNATLVEKLLDAGLIILGKTNMTEFLGLKSNEPIGWSSYMGQTLSPYRRQDLPEYEQPVPGGSSSGSAVSVAAGFCPIAIGTETAGSVVLPASCNGLYAIKLTPGSVPSDGVFQLSEKFDGVGVMARDPADLEALAEILRDGEETGRSALSGDLSTPMDASLAGLSIGGVPSTWGLYADSKDKWSSPDVVEAYEGAVELLKVNGARVVYPLEAPDHEVLSHKGETLTTVAYHEFPGQIQRFIANFDEDPQIKTLADVVRWNQEHANVALPEPYSTQGELIKALNSTMTDQSRLETVAALRKLAGPKGIGKVMAAHDLDLVLAPSDSTLVSFAACAGWPIATVPLSRLAKNGQPYGFFAVSRDGREDLLLRFMAAFRTMRLSS